MALKAATPRTCSIDGCDQIHSGRGLCAVHYVRAREKGELPPLPPRRTKQRCIYEGCEKWRVSHGYCAMHWRRVQIHGDPSIVLKSGRQRAGRLTTLKSGYLMAYEPEHPLATKSGQLLVHRKVLYGLIGPGAHPCRECGKIVAWGDPSKATRLEVDHLDSDRQNNDPANLAPSCHKCNDGQALRRRTRCIHGHDFTPDNTYVGPNGSRRCRACMRDMDRRRVRRKKPTHPQ